MIPPSFWNAADLVPGWVDLQKLLSGPPPKGNICHWCYRVFYDDDKKELHCAACRKERDKK